MNTPTTIKTDTRAAQIIALAALARTRPEIAYVVAYLGVDTAAKLYL